MSPTLVRRDKANLLLVNPPIYDFTAFALRTAGAPSVTAYIIIGHPDSEEQDLESSIRFASDAGARVMAFGIRTDSRNAGRGILPPLHGIG